MSDGTAPYMHRVDGGVSDNLGLRGVLDALTLFEALNEAGQATPLDHVRRVIVFVVNSPSTPPIDWAQSENAPGTAPVLVKAAGVPIDRYSDEQVEQLKDIGARWQLFRELRESPAFAAATGPSVSQIQRAPKARLYVIDVSFAALQDKAERALLNQLPTSFVLKDEEVDRLRAVAGKIIAESPEFQRLLKDASARIVPAP